jgi:hypothetical protein
LNIIGIALESLSKNDLNGEKYGEVLSFIQIENNLKTIKINDRKNISVKNVESLKDILEEKNEN